MSITIIKLIPPEMIDGKTYYADSDGNIRNAKGKILLQQFSPSESTNPNTHGGTYPHVKIGKSRGVHKLVCAAFWGLPKINQVCHHLDGNKFNNRPENLIWLDRSEHPAYDRLVRQGVIYKHVDPFLAAEQEPHKYA